MAKAKRDKTAKLSPAPDAADDGEHAQPEAPVETSSPKLLRRVQKAAQRVIEAASRLDEATAQLEKALARTHKLAKAGKSKKRAKSEAQDDTDVSRTASTGNAWPSEGAD